MSLFRDHLPDPAAYCEANDMPPLNRGGKWFSARCPNCGSSRALRVNRESGANVCMAACGLRGGDIVALDMAIHGRGFVEACKALGAWQDDPSDTRAARRRPLPFPARDALEVLADEANLIAIAGAQLANATPLTYDDMQRVMLAARRIQTIREHCA